ncbi:MAG: PAS domain-containing protein, partial [Thermoleophilia bacterium]|nr:PAS domain-containing protein [Beijerinckiaceae bacterium]MBY0396679.1 PAS domain-containing protein [Thermoleophilia bacterium]
MTGTPPPDRYEHELREVRDRLRLALDAARMGVWDWDVATGRLAWEGRLEEIHGMRPGTFDGTVECFLGAIHPDDRDRARREIEAALRRRADDFLLEFRTLGHDGRIRWVTGEGRVVCDPEGRPVRMVGVGRDVTAEHEAQQALAESEARFRLMADSAPVMIWVADETGACIYFNEPWLRFTGRSVEEELGDGWAERMHPDDRDRCLAVYREAVACREPFEMEYRLRRADGRYRWILDRGVPRRAGGSFAGFVGSCVDFHDRRRAEEAQELLARIGAALLDRPLSHEDRLAALGELLVPAVADACLIEVRGGEDPPRWFAEPPHDPGGATLLRLLVD